MQPTRLWLHNAHFVNPVSVLPLVFSPRCRTIDTAKLAAYLRYAVLVVGLVLMGCQSPSDVDAPPDIRYGEDICDQCRMIISETRFAAAYVTRDGSIRRFDDIGDMLLFHGIHGENVAVFWVHDYETQEWLKADQVFFVTAKDLHTPMGHHIVAVRNRIRAVALAEKVQGDIRKFAQLLVLPPAASTVSRDTHTHMQEAERAKKPHDEAMSQTTFQPSRSASP